MASRLTAMESARRTRASSNGGRVTLISVIVDAQMGADLDRRRNMLPQPIDLRRGEIGSVVELAGSEALDQGLLIFVGIVDHLVDTDVGGVVECRVLHQHDLRVRYPFRHDVGAVADDRTGFGPVVAELLDRVFRHREGDKVGEQLQEVGRRALQGDLERPLVEGPDTELLHALQDAGVQFLGILEWDRATRHICRRTPARGRVERQTRNRRP